MWLNPLVERATLDPTHRESNMSDPCINSSTLSSFWFAQLSSCSVVLLPSTLAKSSWFSQFVSHSLFLTICMRSGSFCFCFFVWSRWTCPKWTPIYTLSLVMGVEVGVGGGWGYNVTPSSYGIYSTRVIYTFDGTVHLHVLNHWSTQCWWWNSPPAL